MKNTLLVILPLFILIWCWDSEEPIKSTENKKWSKIEKNVDSFLIETKKISDYNNETNIEKVWKISSSEIIDVKSLVSGKINNLYVKEWEKVVKWQLLASIEDSYSKYYLDLEKAEIDYQKQIISKESQLLSLEKQINDSKIKYNDALNNYNNAKITTEEDLKKTKLDYENLNIINNTSQSFLQLEKLKLDYENIVNSNKQQLNSNIQNVTKEYNNLVISLNDIIKFSDELLWVTDENKYKNDDFEDYLWAKNKEIRNQSKIKLWELIKYKEEIIDKISIGDLKEENIVSVMDSFYESYDNINTLLWLIETTINNSISSVWSLSDNDINNYISKINWYQSSNQWNLSSFTSTRNSIITFLNTYKNSELSSLKNIELQEKQLNDSSVTWEVSYNKSIISIENSLNNYESAYLQAKLTYENAIKNKDVSLKSLNNSILSAKNNRDKYSLEYSKLTIISPITWIISSIDSDLNSDISNWTKIFTVISDDNTKIEVNLTSTEIWTVDIWDPVKVEYLDKIYYGDIYSKSSVADQNLEYKVVVLLEDNIDLIWASALITFSSKNNNVMLPLDIIEVVSDNIWNINHYSDEWKLEKIEVELWKIESINVEILSPLSNNINIITTDLTNFNELTQSLKINNK